VYSIYPVPQKLVDHITRYPSPTSITAGVVLKYIVDVVPLVGMLNAEGSYAEVSKAVNSTRPVNMAQNITADNRKDKNRSVGFMVSQCVFIIFSFLES
jgi:hypothetical protein